MNNNELKEVERIRSSYTETKATKLDELKALDKKAKLPAEVFAYTFGTAGALVLGTGMCLAMGVIGSGLSVAGVAIGCAGIAMVSANYFIRNKILKSRKSKYADKIFEVSGEILNA